MQNIIKQINSLELTENKLFYVIKVLFIAFTIYFGSLIVGEALVIGGSYLFGYNITDNQLPYDVLLLCSFYGYIVTMPNYLKKVF